MRTQSNSPIFERELIPPLKRGEQNIQLTITQINYDPIFEEVDIRNQTIVAIQFSECSFKTNTNHREV